MGDEPVDVDGRGPRGGARATSAGSSATSRSAPSPPWLQARLAAAGMRPISNVVDVTNYVMHALGNPLHAFDFDTLAGGRIVVRPARAGEELRTLDGTDRKLDPSVLVIADAERAVALAAIMGGEETEVRPETTTVLLEAANFEPVGILRTSERLGLRTDGSNRWEKGVDPHLAEPAAVYATAAPRRARRARGWTGVDRRVGGAAGAAGRPLPPERANALNGLEVPTDDQRAAPRAARLRRRPTTGTVTVPTWRARDVTREADVVEEIARVHLDEIPFTLPRARRCRAARLASSGCAARGRGRARRRRASTRRTRGASSRRTRPGRAPASRAALGRAGGAADDARRRASSRPRSATSTLGTRASRSSRSRACTSRPGSKLPDERRHVAGDRRGRLRAREGRASRRCSRRSGSSRRSSGRSTRCSIPARRRRAGRLARRAAPDAARGDLGRVRARPRRARRARARARRATRT